MINTNRQNTASAIATMVCIVSGIYFTSSCFSGSLAAEKNCTPEETDMLKKLFSLPEDQFNIVLGMIKNMKDE